ncbi:MAG: flagellar protein FlgN [Pseudomonadota bacterium]
MTADDTLFPLMLAEAPQAGTVPAPASAPEPAMDDRAPDTASQSTLLSALERLEELVREETQALRTHADIDFAEISRRKSRSLLELTRIARAVPPRLDGGTLQRVRVLRDALQQNFELLGLHLAATQEVGSILHSAIREAESDGTYSTAMAYGRGMR